MRKWQTKPEKEAEKVLSNFKLECQRLSIPIDLFPLDIEFLGSLLYRLYVERIPHLVHGGKRYPAFIDGLIIGVEETDIPERQRFSIAHEVGHHVLHVVQIAPPAEQLCFDFINEEATPAPRFFRCSEEDFKMFSLPQEGDSRLITDDGQLARKEKDLRIHARREVEANQFAAALLMPADAVQKVFRDLREIRSLAQYFGVSKQAMETRLVSLEILPRMNELQATFW